MVERKIIPSTRGYRIVNYNYMSRLGFQKTQTVVVRVPNSRHRTFETALVVTEGIQGQPQLTFDSWRAARDWLDSHEEYNRICSISATRSTYDCVKIPLADGSEGWLSVSMLHPGSDYWEWLGELYPNYFKEEPPERQQPVLRGGWFNESIYKLSDESININDIKLSPGDCILTANDFEVSWLAPNTYYYMGFNWILDNDKKDFVEKPRILFWANKDNGTFSDPNMHDIYNLGNYFDESEIEFDVVQDQIKCPGTIVSYNGHPVVYDDSKSKFKGGWFNEDINNKEDEEWLLDTFGIDLLTLKRLLGYNEADWHITFESEKDYTVFNILKKDTEEGDMTLGQAVEWYGYDQVFDFIYRLLNEAYDQKILL